VVSYYVPLVQLRTSKSNNYYNFNEKLVINAELNWKSDTSIPNILAKWSIDDDSLNLNSSALTPTYQSISKPKTIFIFPLSVIIDKNYFSRNSYKLTLTLFENGESFVSNSITVQINTPPNPGYFSIIPESGRELRTEFSMRASFWDDEDIPLFYQYLFLSNQGSYVTIREKTQTSSILSLLPAGNPENFDMITCVLYVFDYYEGRSEATAKIKVQPSPKDYGLMTEVITNSSKIEDTDLMMSSLATVSNLLWRKNCSSAPVCSKLFRMECSYIGYKLFYEFRH
jgi:hypothetical protein